MIIARYDAILNQSERAQFYNYLRNYTNDWYQIGWLIPININLANNFYLLILNNQLLFSSFISINWLSGASAQVIDMLATVIQLIIRLTPTFTKT